MVMVSKPESSFWRTISFWLMAGSFVVIGCGYFNRHCEERSDEAIHASFAARWIASLRSQ
jgi:hypothetical protein